MGFLDDFDWMPFSEDTGGIFGFGGLGLDPAGVVTGEGMAGGSMGETGQVIADPMDLFGHQARAGEEEAKAIEQQALNLQKDWMNYVRSEYAPYSEIAKESLAAQRGYTELGTPEQKAEIISGIESDPFYQAKVGAGQDAVLRGASATGGLRSGDAQSALALQNQMLLDQEIKDRYNRLAGLSGQGFMGAEAGTKYGGEALGGVTDVLGAMASGNAARQAAKSDKQAGMMGMAGGIMSMFSDERLKDNIVQIGYRKGLPWYSWTWNALAEKLFGLKGSSVGFMASDVEEVYPELVAMKDGYKTVMYGGVHNDI